METAKFAVRTIVTVEATLHEGKNLILFNISGEELVKNEAP